MRNLFGSEKEIDQSFSHKISVRSNFPHNDWNLNIWYSWAKEWTKRSMDRLPAKSKRKSLVKSFDVFKRADEMTTTAAATFAIRWIFALPLLIFWVFFFSLLLVFHLNISSFFCNASNSSYGNCVYICGEHARARDSLNARFVMNDWMSNAEYVCILLQVVLVHLVRSPC